MVSEVGDELDSRGEEDEEGGPVVLGRSLGTPSRGYKAIKESEGEVAFELADDLSGHEVFVFLFVFVLVEL